MRYALQEYLRQLSFAAIKHMTTTSVSSPTVLWALNSCCHAPHTPLDARIRFADLENER